MFRVVRTGDAVSVEIAIEMDARTARAFASLDVGQGLGRQLDLFQVFVADANALGVRSKTVKVKSTPTGSQVLPVETSAANTLGVKLEGEPQFVVVKEGRLAVLAVSVFRQADVKPLIDAIAVGRPLALYGLTVAGSDVDLGFERRRPAGH